MTEVQRRRAERNYILYRSRFELWLAKATTGAYKRMKLERGSGRNPDGSTTMRSSTEEEKLEYCLGVAQNHLDRMQDCS